MPVDLDPAVRDAILARAAAVREAMAGGGDWDRWRWQLGGKEPLVAPGASIIMRLLPRWDIKQKYVAGKDGKAILSPAYKPQVPFFEALEHWWDTAKGATRDWCPKTFDENAPCPICEAAAELLGSQVDTDRKAGSRLRAKWVFLFNAMAGPFGQRRFGEDGKVDIRALPANNTLFSGISDIMTGGQEGAFARGDICDPRAGFDIKLIRPTGGGGVQWKVEPDVRETPLWGPQEAERFRGWADLLHDIPEKVRGEILSYDDLYKRFHGVADEGAEAGGGEGLDGGGGDTAPDPGYDPTDFAGGAPSTAAPPAQPTRQAAPPPQPAAPSDADFLMPPDDFAPGGGATAAPPAQPARPAGGGRGAAPGARPGSGRGAPAARGAAPGRGRR